MSNLSSRRAFLKVSAVGLAAFALPIGCASKTGGVNVPYLANLGTQLWTVRHEMNADFDSTIRRVAAMGWKGFETFPLPENLSLSAAAKLYRELNMPVVSCHFGLPTADNIDDIRRMTDAYGQTKVIYHSWPEEGKFENMENTQRTVDSYNYAYDLLQRHGLEFGLHNHWWEFESKAGITPAYYLLEHINEGIFFEIDTYWAQASGVDPAKIVKDFGARTPFLHIKDGSAKQDDTLMDHVIVGQGSVDVPAVVAAAGENVKWLVVEFDEHKGDIFEELQASYAYMVSNNLGKGNV